MSKVYYSFGLNPQWINWSEKLQIWDNYHERTFRRAPDHAAGSVVLFEDNGVCSVKEAPVPVEHIVGYRNSSDTP